MAGISRPASSVRKAARPSSTAKRRSTTWPPGSVGQGVHGLGAAGGPSRRVRGCRRSRVVAKWPPPLLYMPSGPRRLTVSGRQRVQRDVRSALARQFELARAVPESPAHPCDSGRPGSARRWARRAGKRRESGVRRSRACRGRRRPGRGPTGRARRAASPCSAQSTWATSPSTSLMASTWAAKATASVGRRWRAPRAPARAATTLGSARPQPSSSTFVPGAGGWSLQVAGERRRRSATAAPSRGPGAPHRLPRGAAAPSRLGRRNRRRRPAGR